MVHTFGSMVVLAACRMCCAHILSSGRSSKDLKCVVVRRRLWSVVCGPWSVSIDSHVRTYYYVNNVQYYFTK